jgi:hypothetical protein
VRSLDAVKGFEVITNRDEEVFDALDGFAFGALDPTWEPEIEGFEHGSICGAERGRLEKDGSFFNVILGDCLGVAKWNLLFTIRSSELYSLRGFSL